MRTIQLILTLFIIIRVKSGTAGMSAQGKQNERETVRERERTRRELVSGSVTTAHAVVTLISRAACYWLLATSRALSYLLSSRIACGPDLLPGTGWSLDWLPWLGFARLGLAWLRFWVP